MDSSGRIIMVDDGQSNLDEQFRTLQEKFKDIEKVSPQEFKALRDDDKLISITKREVKFLANKDLFARKNHMRNKPCPCGSGKKYKKCCWPKGM